MPIILSPQPLAARGQHFSIQSMSNFSIYEPSFSTPISRGRASSSHPPLMSPIQLAPSAVRTPSIIPKSLSKPPTKRREHTSRPPRRRRPLSRVEFPVEPSTHAFDHLPWISALETAPDHYNPGNIADLSQFDTCFASNLSPSGLGPIRRRKTSLRANPLSPTQALPTSTFSGDSAWAAGSALPFCDTPNQSADPLSPPSTPYQRFDASRILFHNLMPVSRDPHNDGPDDFNLTPFHH